MRKKGFAIVSVLIIISIICIILSSVVRREVQNTRKEYLKREVIKSKI